MSDCAPSSASRNEDDKEDIDIDLLIAEIKRRPPLFENDQAQHNREVRRKLWTEVCQAVFRNWEKFDLKKKKERAKDVQTEWRILRDTYYKKFGGVNTLTVAPKKRRRHYLNSLSFLMSTMRTPEDNNNEPEIDVPMDNTPGITTDMPSTSMPPTLAQAWQFPEIKSLPEFAPPTRIENQKDELDEDSHFALMLVPMMRKFTDEQRYHARITILRNMRQISLMGQEKISVLQEELKYVEPMQDVNYQVPETAAFEDGQEYPVPAPIVEGRPTNPEGEIQYPETDNEDVDV